jgi:limonene 1,2-monooxygenase
MSGTHNFELCGQRGYAALSIYFTPARIIDNPGMPDLIAQGAALAAAAEAKGHDPAKARSDWRICREVYVSDSKNAAMAEIRETLKQSYDYLFKLGLAPLMKTDASMADADVTFDWMVEHIPWIIGSPAECVTQLGELHEAVGGFGTLLFNSREWVTVDRWYRSLELFARYVSPHFRRLDDQRFRAELAEDALGG